MGSILDCVGKFFRKFTVVRTPEQSSKRKEVLPPMANSPENGTTILLGLKGYEVGEVWGGEDRVRVRVIVIVKTEVKGREKCPHCGSGKVYGHGMCKLREVLHTWSNGKKVYLEPHRRRWGSRTETSVR